MGKTFVISDTWFNRSKDESGQTISERNSEIINNWNSAVSSEDTVYVLGGFGISDLTRIASSLSGKLIFLNNYYTSEEKNFIDTMMSEVSNSIDDYMKEKIVFVDKQIISIPELDVVLTYLPVECWPGSDCGVFCFHGMTYGDNFSTKYISCVSDKWNHKPIDIEKIKNDVNHFCEIASNV